MTEIWTFCRPTTKKFVIRIFILLILKLHRSLQILITPTKVYQPQPEFLLYLKVYILSRIKPYVYIPAKALILTPTFTLTH